MSNDSELTTSWIEDVFLSLFLILAFLGLSYLGFLGISTLLGIAQIPDQVCSVKVYVNNQPQTYSAKRSSIGEGLFRTNVRFIDETSQQDLSFGNAPYSVSCSINKNQK